jgi:DNA-binding response OmpR family regulator
METSPTPATKYVLILDDNEPLAGMLVSLLSDELPEHRFLPARNIEEAQLLASEFVMDLFILDINLPDGTGLDFLCDVRTIAPDARALMMTAMPLPAYQRRAESLGVIHFLKKPFDFSRFVELVKALLDPHMPGPSDSFFGTLRDLHLTDIIQIKCLSGVTAVVEFTSPSGEKGTIHFEAGQITHAHAPRQEGVAAFQTIVGWRGGSFAELTAVGHTPQTIFQDWQVLLIEAVRRSDEQAALAHGSN